MDPFHTFQHLLRCSVLFDQADKLNLPPFIIALIWMYYRTWPRVAVIGGMTDPEEDANVVSVYTPWTKKWTTTAVSLPGMTCARAVQAPSGKILVVKSREAVTSSKCYVFDPHHWSCHILGGYPAITFCKQLCVLKKHVMCFGVSFGQMKRVIYEYDEQRDHWERKGTPSAFIFNNVTPDSVVFDGGLLYIGGVEADVVHGKCWRYNVEKEELSEFPPLLNPRYNHASIVTPSGSVLVTGGQIAYNTSLDTCELFDGREWSSVAKMTTPRWGHTLALIDGNTVMAIGGNNKGWLNTCEFFDIPSRTWSRGPDLPATQIFGAVVAFV